MVTLTHFNTTTSWQELTGVSQSVGNFTIQNVGRNSFLLYEGETPNDTDSKVINKIGLNNNNFLFTTPQKNKIWVRSAIPTRISISNSANVDILIQDQNSDIVDYFLCRNIRDLEIATDMSLGDYDVTLVEGSLVTVGNYISIQEDDRAFQAKILSKDVDVITIDTPSDYEFTTLASIAERNPNMNIDGSSTPVIFELKPIAGVAWDITRILLTATMSGSGSDILFCDIAALTKGIVLRKANSDYHTIFNAKTNGDLAQRMYDIIYTDKAVPTQTYGLRGKRSFNGLDKNGVTIRLDGDKGESLQILVQDDLTDILTLRAVAQGHVVE